MAAAITVDDIRRAYYDAAGTTLAMWVTEVQLQPPQLIVGDESTAKLYRVPYSISADGEISFGDAQQVQIEYADVAAAVAAAKARGRPVRRPVRAARGGGYDPGQVKRANATYQMISKALERGALSPRSALTWAARAGRGEDITVVASLTGIAATAQANRKVMAHSNTQIAQQIMNLLSQAIDGAPDAEDDEFAGLFPPNDMARLTLIYDQNPDGSRPPPISVPDATMPPGYQYGTTDNVHQPWASAGHRDRYDDSHVITDQQADMLYPPATAAEAQRRYDAAVEAGALKPYSDDDLGRLLFGDHDGRES